MFQLVHLKDQYLVLYFSPIDDITENLISLTRLFADDTSFSYSNGDELKIKAVIDHDLKERMKGQRNG
jgi:hypothetical protein